MNPAGPTPSLLDLAKMIDHSLLHPTLTRDQVQKGLETAKRWACATACVKPCDVPLATEVLKGSSVQVCAVAGFPHGNSHPELKLAEAQRALDEGATEIDMVVNIGRVLGGEWSEVTAEIDVLNQLCVKRGALLKVIFENDYLRDEHIVRLCQICTDLGVAFVKTSSGYGFVKQANGDYNYQGATDAHLKLMREHSGPGVQVKAAGGVRSLDDLLRVRALGVTRIGATATEAILRDAAARGFPGSLPGLSLAGSQETAGY